MIYDKLITIYDLDQASSALQRRLIHPVAYLCAEKEVFGSRYFTALAAGEQIDRMAELWRADIRAGQYAVPEDGHVYRILQVQSGENADHLPITTLTLRREDNNYDIHADNRDA